MKTSYLMNKTFHFSIFTYIKLNNKDIDYFISLFKQAYKEIMKFT